MALEIFDIAAQNGAFLGVYSPAQYDAKFVGAMKALRGAYCRKDAGGFRWEIAADARGADEFRAIVERAVVRAGGPAVTGMAITAENLAHHMYSPNGRLYG